MKKQLLYVIAILLLTVTVAGGTYAFFVSATTNANNIVSNASKFEVIYTGGGKIEGPVTLSADKEGGKNTTVNIRVAEGSVPAKATIYINIEKITSNLAVKGFKWEVYGYQDGQEVYSKTGDFDGKTDNSIINIVEKYQLSEKNTSFTLYLWLDGNMLDNSIIGGEFSGYIGAETENFTAQLQ